MASGSTVLSKAHLYFRQLLPLLHGKIFSWAGIFVAMGGRIPPYPLGNNVWHTLCCVSTSETETHTTKRFLKMSIQEKGE
jgi:hypothetical protein